MDRKFVVNDLLAGLTVSFAALSLGAAFGSMSGRGAFAGMVGAAVIPIITSALGGTRIQASGPTAPMTAVTALAVASAYEMFPEKVLAEQFITLVLLLSGLFMFLAGVFRTGKLIKLVPNAVVLGFMNGIAVLIWFDQISKLFGVSGKKVLEGGSAINSFIAVTVISLIFAFPVLLKKIGVSEKYRPLFSPLLFSIVIMTMLSSFLGLNIESVKLGNTINSIGEFLDLISSYFPSSNILTSDYIIKAIPYAFQLTLLGYLDSLLTALVIDRMTKEETKFNKELIAQGSANFISGVFQGIPGAQATIRSVLLVKENAKTRMAGVFLGLFVLVSILFFKGLITLIPAAVFSGVLFKAGWDVCDRDFIYVYFKLNWFKSVKRNFQMFITLITTLITVLVDLNVAVFTGTILFYGSKYFFKNLDLSDVEIEFEEDVD